MTTTLSERIFTIQKELGKVQKDGTNPHFNSTYVTYPALMTTLRPLLMEHNLLIEHSGTESGLLTTLSMLDGDDTRTSLQPWVDFDKASNPAQAMGGFETYARRYNVFNLFDILTDDDDGNSVGAKPQNGNKYSTAGKGKDNRPWVSWDDYNKLIKALEKDPDYTPDKDKLAKVKFNTKQREELAQYGVQV